MVAHVPDGTAIDQPRVARASFAPRAVAVEKVRNNWLLYVFLFLPAAAEPADRLHAEPRRRHQLPQRRLRRFAARRAVLQRQTHALEFGASVGDGVCRLRCLFAVHRLHERVVGDRGSFQHPQGFDAGGHARLRRADERDRLDHDEALHHRHAAAAAVHPESDVQRTRKREQLALQRRAAHLRHVLAARRQRIRRVLRDDGRRHVRPAVRGRHVAHVEDGADDVHRVRRHRRGLGVFAHRVRRAAARHRSPCCCCGAAAGR